ncbi:MAG: phosphoglycerate dehydrogenase, partial [Calditrichia bacterium]
MFRILIADTLPEKALVRYRNLPDIHIENKAGISADELRQILPEYDGLVVRSRTTVGADILFAAEQLKVIGRAGAGVDNIDIKEATLRGIIVMNTPGGNTIAATEHTIALILAALRNIPQANFSLREGKWNRKAFTGKELFGKTVGIVGFGKIGQEVAKRLAAFEATLLVYDPILTGELADRFGVTLVSFSELLNQSDIITIHAPKIKETLNLFNENTFSQCKDGVILINCARGGIVNEQHLLKALDSGKVGAAALDVFEKEPPQNRELINHPRCICTPHLGASTEEAQSKVAEQILEQMIKYFKTNVADHAVNFISVDEKLQPLIAPYFELAYRIGRLFSKIQQERLGEAVVRFYGEILNYPAEPIASYLMTGALQSGGVDSREQTVEIINPVNALTIAKEKGIKLEISKRDRPLTSHTNLIECEFKTGEDMIQLAATVYVKNIYRLVNFNGYNLDVELSEKLVIIENEDVPGIIGKVGTILAGHKINIGQVSSGRI